MCVDFREVETCVSVKVERERERKGEGFYFYKWFLVDICREWTLSRVFLESGIWRENRRRNSFDVWITFRTVKADVYEISTLFLTKFRYSFTI